MRKPLLALGLAVSAGLGATPVAGALAAATPTTHSRQPSPTYSSSSNTPVLTPLASSSASAAGVSGAAIVQTALKYIGYPYTATGNSPATGFSCIGFVSYVYRSNGITLPGDLQDALAYAPQVPFSDLQPGDILYFQNTVWRGISHAAIYLGGGRFVHAEWYNRGVTTSSFNNDPVDGNYWIGKYLGANRPWNGAAVSSVIGTGAPGRGQQPGNAPTVRTAPSVASGPTAVVSVTSLNVRSNPSMKGSVRQVVPQGTSVVVLGQRHGWYHVQLPDGTVGWVVAEGIGQSGASTSVTTNAAATIGNPVAPARQGAPKTGGHTTVRSNSTEVHTYPSTASPIVSFAVKGQSVKVLGKSNGWEKVQLSNGSVGWVKASATSGHKTASSLPPASVSSFNGGSTATVATNVRSGRSLHSTVREVIPTGGSYKITGWSHGWAHVQLPDGTTGWVSGTVLGKSSPSTSGSKTYKSYAYHRPHKATTSRSTSGGSVVTAGVRVHSAPGVKSPVIGGASAGTHVKVLGYKNGWALVRLPGGQTGYILGSYVH